MPADFPDRLFLVRAGTGKAPDLNVVFDPEDALGVPSQAYLIDQGIDWERLARQKYHPTQIDVIELLSVDSGRVLSPNEMAFELQEELPNVSYHVKELVKAGQLELVDTAQRRGALEHYYRLVGSPA